MAGVLYLVATPIGNLEDITYRAARILAEADLIACEDTRQTRKLLDHLGIHRPTISYHEHNEAERALELVRRIEDGEHVALVSDAGAPLISDPGFRLVREALDHGIPVVPIPGPSALLTALAASGLETDGFCFLGFLPPKGARRREAIERIQGTGSTVVLYEAPHRVLATLADLAEALGDRPVVAAREMTKLHEEFLRGTAASIRADLAGRPAVKGEFTLVIGKRPNEAPAGGSDEEIRAAVASLIESGTPKMDAIRQTARRFARAKREVYGIVEDAP